MNEFITVSLDSRDNKINTDHLGDKKYRSGMALLIPISDDTPYVKSTTEAAVNTMWRMTSALRPNTSRVSFQEAQQGKTDEQIHEDLMMLVKDTANFMQKIVHSSSYRNGTVESHDISNFKRDIDRLMSTVEYMERRQSN